MEEIVVVVQEEKLIPQERVQQRTVDYVSAPQFRKEAVGVVLAPTARGHHWIGEQIVEWERLVDVPVPKTPERERRGGDFWSRKNTRNHTATSFCGHSSS